MKNASSFYALCVEAFCDRCLWCILCEGLTCCLYEFASLCVFHLLNWLMTYCVDRLNALAIKSKLLPSVYMCINASMSSTVHVLPLLPLFLLSSSLSDVYVLLVYVLLLLTCYDAFLFLYYWCCCCFLYYFSYLFCYCASCSFCRRISSHIISYMSGSRSSCSGAYPLLLWYF